MCSNNHMNCGCASFNKKGTIGPFVAIDVANITTPPVNTGSIPIIPFASGIQGTFLTTTAGGLVDALYEIGFGDANLTAALPGGDIDSSLVTEAFSVTRAGSIAAISAAFTTVTLILPLAGTVTVRAQVYRSATNSNVFTPTNAFVDIVPIAMGTIGRGLKIITPPVLVEAGDLLIMVFSATATGLGDLTNSFFGSASAGITIA
ncbi:hypothetical protein [Sporosarcina sp. BP05]|uniref:hypothetical protein n=1 Tax=Sporosarcina sp. BP05 TaxID=2758726 RepID=UPI001646616C|nr:hypothetical protein [Sporosarcina sp. BP05]